MYERFTPGVDLAPILVGYAIYGIVLALLTGYVAETKNRSSGGWFVAGFFLGVLALLAIGLSSPALREEKGRDDEDTDTKVCPRCAETIKRAALVCRYCAYEYPQRERGEDWELRFGMWTVEWSDYGKIRRRASVDLALTPRALIVRSDKNTAHQLELHETDLRAKGDFLHVNRGRAQMLS